MDIEKELQQLKQRIASLETQKNVLFGNSYSSAGSSSSDYLIKTRGKVKIQIGNKFIDLLKDGKINVDSKFIFKEKEVGSKDGIYIIGDGGDAKVIISIGGSQIDLKGEIGTTYVSFLGTQETTPEQKHTALQNIGFLYQNVSDVQSNGLKTGIVYVESEQKLYIVQDGQLTAFTIEFPNPYPKQFVISKTDKDKGALVIKGSGTENSLAFDSLLLYSSGGNTYIDSSGEIYMRIGEEEKVLIGESQVVFSNKVISQTFQSKNATESSGFRLYVDQGKSTLEVDNLIVRKSSKLSSNNVLNLYPKYWYRENNLISDISEMKDPDNPDQIGYAIDLVYQNKFQVKDSLYAFASVKQDGDLVSSLVLLPLKVESLNTETGNTIYVSLQQDLISEEDYKKLSSDKVLSALKLQTVFLAGRDDSISLIRRDSQNIDLLTSSGFTDEQDTKKVQTRIGNIEELNLVSRENNEEIPIKGIGMYSDNACFLKAQYTSPYDLPLKDSSSKFASTEWVNKLIPKGSIIMFNGTASEIPEGWHICDGQEGTPNLINSFIKGGDTSTLGNTGGNVSGQVTLTVENLPAHSHTYALYGGLSDASDHGDGWYEVGKSYDEVRNTSIVGEGKPFSVEPQYYTLIYIMKIK